MSDAAGPLTSCRRQSLSSAELVSRHCRHWQFQTSLTPSAGRRRSGGTKM